jgi:hypothetical protein
MITPRLVSRLLLAAACVLVPPGAGAQSCIGMPLEWRPTAVTARYGAGAGISLYQASTGRRLGNDLFLSLDYTHGRFSPAAPLIYSVDASSGNAGSATVAYRLTQLHLPVCTVASLRYGRSTSRHTQQPWDAQPLQFVTEASGAMALTGLGVGREVPVSANAAVIPFALGQLGWSQITHRETCSRDCSGLGFAEGYLHLEGEAGVALLLGRVHLTGVYRLALPESDPLLRSGTSYGSDWISLLGLGMGVAF